MDSYYKEVGSILKEVWCKRNSARALVYKCKLPRKNCLLKMTLSVCRYREQLENIRAKAAQATGDEFFNEHKEVALALLYDFCYNRPIKRSKLTRRHILRQQEKLENLKGLCSIGIPKQPNCIKLPTYVRVNTLKTTLAEVRQKLKGLQLKELPTPDDRNAFHEMVKNLREDEYCVDYDVDHLLVFRNSSSYTLAEGFDLILMDKSSFLPVLALELDSGMSVLDCCAAPGNKAAIMAAELKNDGNLTCVDISEPRWTEMKFFLENCGVQCAKYVLSDFLSIRPRRKEYQKITHILLDPPCSGSGMVKRLDAITDDGPMDRDRIKTLRNLQAKMLKHALYFPQVQRCVYSTCSIDEEENEAVIEEVARKLADRYELEKIFPAWEHRGLSKYKCGEYCIRCDPDSLMSSGFFVACFVKKGTVSG